MKKLTAALVLPAILMLSLNLSAQTYWLARKDGNNLRYDVKAPADLAAIIKTANKEGWETTYSSSQKNVGGKTWTFHKNIIAWDGSIKGSVTWEGKDGIVGEKWQDINMSSPDWKNCWDKSIAPISTVWDANWKAATVEMLENPGTSAPGVVIDMTAAPAAPAGNAGGNPAPPAAGNPAPPAAGNNGPLTKEQSIKVFVEKLNQFRTDPSKGNAIIEELLKRRGASWMSSKEYTQDDIRGKTREQHHETFKTWLKTQTKVGALTWDDELAKVATAGKTSNKFTKLEFRIDAWADPLDDALGAWAVDGENNIQRLRDPRLKYIGIAPKPGGTKEEFIIVASETKGSIYTAKDADFGNRPFQLDVTALQVSEKSSLPYERCPQIIGYPNTDGSLNIAWLAADGSKIFVHRAGSNLQAGQTNQLEQQRVFNSLGLFAGYTRIGDDDFVLSAERHTMPDQPQALKLFKNSNSSMVWSGKNPDKPGVLSPLYAGSSKLAAGDGKLFVAVNGGYSHPYVAMVDANKMNQTDPISIGYNTHNFDNRLLWDGKKFVVMENRDHSYGTVLLRFSPSEKYPFEGHDERVRTIHSAMNYANDSHTELGAIQPGLNGGYLAVIATEQDWDDKFGGKPHSQTSPIVNTDGMTNPFDIALVHVKANFDETSFVTRLDPKRTSDGMVELKDGGAVDFGDEKPESILEQYKDNLTFGGSGFEPWYVDASRVVNSIGEHKTVSRNSTDDGFNYKLYSGNQNAYNEAAARRHITTAGVVWATNYRDGFTDRIPKGEKFTTAQRPRLVKISEHNYIAIWEEHSAEVSGCIAFSNPRYTTTYVTTKAAKVTLSGSGDQVKINVGAPKEVTNVRLHWQDDAFNYQGKAAWLTGDAANRKIILNTVDGNLNYKAFELGL